jgi:hypothetical protein
MPIATRIARLAITRRRRFLPMDGADFPATGGGTAKTRCRKRAQLVGMLVTVARTTRSGEIGELFLFMTVDISDLRWAG